LADEALALALADCLESLREGDAALAAALARYPAQRKELEELLRVVDLIPVLPAGLSPDPAFVSLTRTWLSTLPGRPLDPGPDPALP
jgi:hypothetical protein